MTMHLQANAVDVGLVPCVPATWWPLVWAWVQEFPDSNLDDASATNWQEFAAAHDQGLTWGVTYCGQPVGFIGGEPVNDRVAFVRGLVFAACVHGTGVPRIAVERVLGEMFHAGLKKLQATYYVHNVRVGTFLRSLGAVEEGVLRDQVTQHGKLVSMKIVAIFAPREKLH